MQSVSEYAEISVEQSDYEIKDHDDGIDEIDMDDSIDDIQLNVSAEDVQVSEDIACEEDGARRGLFTSWSSNVLERGLGER